MVRPWAARPGCLVHPWAGLLGAPVGGAVGLLGVPVGRVAWCARGRRPAREIATREPDGSEWSISKPGQAPPQPGLSVPLPPTAAAARPRRRPRPPQPGPSVPPPPTSAAAGPRLEAWPGPSGGDLKYQRIQPSSALPVLSPVREIIRPVWLVACLCAKEFALQARKRRKTPFLGVLGELFRGSVVVWGVLGELFRGTAVERGRWESFVPGLALGAVQSSPCWGAWWCERYKVLPARAKRAEMGNFWRVGRVLYRLGCWCGCAGRVLYRRYC